MKLALCYDYFTIVTYDRNVVIIDRNFVTTKIVVTKLRLYNYLLRLFRYYER